MAIEDLFEMKRKPGVIILGRDNIRAEQVFNEISNNLYDFYLSQGSLFEEMGLLFVSQLFEIGQDKYFNPVYVNDVPDMEFSYDVDESGQQIQKKENETKLIKHANIKIERFDERRRVEFVKEWDFAHAPFRSTQQIFGVYFNLEDISKANVERTAFLNYVKGR